MSLTDARREVSAMHATFALALDEGADAVETTALALRAAGRGLVDAETISRILRDLVHALEVLRDATMTWAAMDTVMREIER